MLEPISRLWTFALVVSRMVVATCTEQVGSGTLEAMATLDDATQFASELPQVVEGERHGNRTWDVGGKTFAWVRPFSKADVKRYGDAIPPTGPIVAVRVADLDEKESMLAAHPKGLFTIPHFDGYAAVLIHLKVVTKKVLKETLIDGWLACAPEDVARLFLKR
jgi:hypothetical protein